MNIKALRPVMKTIKIKYSLLLIILLQIFLFARGEIKELKISADEKGFIPAWLVAGPFELPVKGFGQPADTNAIGEPDIAPASGLTVTSCLPDKETKKWFVQSLEKNGFLDLNKTVEWDVNTKLPVKFWYVKAGYAYTKVYSENEREALLTVGGNSFLTCYLNKKMIYTGTAESNAIPDKDTIKIKLKKGINELIVRVCNTHKNLGLAYFGMIKWEWGFYPRLLDKEGKPLREIYYVIDNGQKENSLNAISTIYYKKDAEGLMQRVDLEINSVNTGIKNANVKFNVGGKNYSFLFDSVKPGKTRYAVYLSEITKKEETTAELTIGNEKVNQKIILEPRKKYKLHLMLLNHMDIGYTHPQPVCEEIHCITLDEVLKWCDENPDFKWTIETTWQLEAYERLRSHENFMRVINYIKTGRIALSPIYSNPYTGMVSREEMMRSFEKAFEYKNKYGIAFNAAVYNDVPGEAWIMPQVLSKAGVKFLANGINEFYGEFRYQKTLPKVFKWKANDGASVVNYITEAYNEGKSYGLESDNLLTVEQKTWEHINLIENRNYAPDIVLINSSYSDNSIPATHQYLLAKKWNEQYEYPKFVPSNADMFADELLKSDSYKELPELKGDWTSDWDIRAQGEFERNKKIRWIQHQAVTAEKLSTLSALLDNKKAAMNDDLAMIYRNTLHFNGHGSGLEFGYGSPEANLLTLQYRDNYVNGAFYKTHEVLQKAMHRLTVPEETFESEGVYVFNPLSWRRNDIVELQYTFNNSPAIDVIDASTKTIIPSFRKDHRQFFLAENLPSFGFKKYLLKPHAPAKTPESGLKKTENSIENEFYKITYNSSEGKVTGIVEKKSGKEIISAGELSFGIPTVEKFQLKQNHSPITGVKSSIDVIDESPVRMIVRIKNEGSIFSVIEYVLNDKQNQVQLNATADLAVLKSPQYFEEYGIPFCFNIKDAKIENEIIGGFLDIEKGRLAGANNDAVSLRRSVAVFNDKESIIWSSADARIARIRKDAKTGAPIIISTPVNNFPKEWNRNEDNTGKVEFRYSFKYEPRSFNAADAAQFGCELCTPAQPRRSYYRSQPSTDEYLTIDNKNILLLNLKKTADGFIARLVNVDNYSGQDAVVKSKLFNTNKAEIIDLGGAVQSAVNINDNSAVLKFKPAEIIDLLVRPGVK